jgi:hypothetical protein
MRRKKGGEKVESAQDAQHRAKCCWALVPAARPLRRFFRRPRSISHERNDAKIGSRRNDPRGKGFLFFLLFSRPTSPLPCPRSDEREESESRQ